MPLLLRQYRRFDCCSTFSLKAPALTKSKTKIFGTKSRTDQVPLPTNTNIDSFEALMDAMDAELRAQKQQKTAATSTATSSTFAKHTSDHWKGNGKGKEKAKATDDALRSGPEGSSSDDEDIEEAMAAELKAALEGDGDDDDDDGLGGETEIDYNLIKNFLKSFKAQGGEAGPVSNLTGRLQDGLLWQLGRDTD